MDRNCEICRTRPGPAAGAKGRLFLRRIRIEDRLLALCGEHADRVRQAAPRTLAELAALFAEGSGRRTLIERRSPLDRRVFPARPEGRRRNVGRRTHDDG